ncbi:MAG: hypothetical protein PWQ10_526 [Patescibacteria group bacterium]|nr:hypothetical protein [Patescibacteria group bacterium]
MNTEEKTSSKNNIANLFGTFGYFFCLLQWLWVILLYSSFVEFLISFIESNNVNTQVSKPVFVIAPNPVIESGFDMISTLIAIIIIVFMVGLSLYFLVKMPSIILNSSKKVVHEVAESTAPIVLRVQHKKETKKSKIKLTSQLIIIIKLVLVISPLIIAFMSQFIEKQVIEFYISMYVGLFLALFSAVSFVIQYMVNKACNKNECI